MKTHFQQDGHGQLAVFAQAHHQRPREVLTKLVLPLRCSTRSPVCMTVSCSFMLDDLKKGGLL